MHSGNACYRGGRVSVCFSSLLSRGEAFKMLGTFILSRVTPPLAITSRGGCPDRPSAVRGVFPSVYLGVYLSAITDGLQRV